MPRANKTMKLRDQKLQLCFAIIGCLTFGHFLQAEELKHARVTQVVNDVKLLPGQAAPRPAVINDEVKQGTGVRTGIDSRSELTFSDQTIARLAANTVFSFDRERRELKLSNGAALIQIPPGAPEIKVSTAAVSAAITGGTALFDAPTGKLLIMEGQGRMWSTEHPDEIVIVHPGEVVWLLGQGQLSRPRQFDVKRVLETSRLIKGFKQLPNIELILKTIDSQDGTPSLPDKNIIDIISQRPEGSPTPRPQTVSEFGPPQTILIPAPYDIGSSTLIITDPTITNNGVTDLGTIYRNQGQDGPIATWAFGSTSAFDVVSGFDSNFNPLLQNIAVFKFQQLNLNAQPTIMTDGGPNRLGLIAVDGINSTGEGGTFTFAGLDFVFLATQNGAINLGSQITFDGMNRLLLYARGPNGNLNLSSNFNDIGRLDLNAEGAIQISGMVVSHSGGTIDLQSGGPIDIQSGSQLLSLQGSDAGAGGVISIFSVGGSVTLNGEIAGKVITVGAGGNLSIGSDAVITPGAQLSLSATGNIQRTEDADFDGIALGIDNTARSINNFSSVRVAAGGNVTTSGPVGFFINNTSGGSIGTDATISLTAANVSGSDLSEIIDLTGGRVGGDVLVAQNVSGNVTVGGQIEYRILNFGDGTTGIGGNAGIAVSANNISANGIVADIDSGGGPIGGKSTITFDVSGTVHTNKDVNTHIEFSGGNTGQNAITFNGGTYNVGGLFTSFISGADGTITLNNANVHADAVKVSAFGDNGVLRIGGGSINANTLLHLYAPGSNGVIDFVANVTLNSRGAAAIINANTVTIENNVVVTITGAGGPVVIYTNHPNYSGSGGNGSTTGTFAGNGAVTSPSGSPPPFVQATASAKSAVEPSTTSDPTSTDGRRRNGRRRFDRTTKLTSFAQNGPASGRHVDRSARVGIRVRNTDQLLDLVDEGAKDPDVFRHHARVKSQERGEGKDNRRDRSGAATQNVRLSDRHNENGRSPRL